MMKYFKILKSIDSVDIIDAIDSVDNIDKPVYVSTASTVFQGCINDR